MTAEARRASVVGRELVRALAAKDVPGFVALFDPEVDFRGLTPGNGWRAMVCSGFRPWEAAGPA